MARGKKSTTTTSIRNRYITHSKPISMVEIGDLRRYCEFMTRTAGLVLRWDPEAVTARTDGHTIYLPEFNSRMTEADAHRLGAFVVHESAHHRHGRDLFRIMKENPMTPDSPLAAILNLIEDERIERKVNSEYRGDGIRLSDGSYHGGARVYEMYSEYKKQLPPGGSMFTDETEKITGMQAIHIEASADWNKGKAVGFAPVIKDFYTPGCFAAAEKLRDKLDIIERIRGLKNEEETWQLAKEAYEVLFEESAQEHLDKCRERLGEAGEDGDMVEGDAGEGNGGKKGKAKDGLGKGRGGKAAEYDKDATGEAGFDPQEGKLKVTDLVLSPHSHEKPFDGPGGHGMGFDFTEYKEQNGTWQEWPGDHNIVDYAHGANGSRGRDGSSFDHWLKSVRRSAQAEAGFANQARRLLQVRSAARYEHNHKSGRLHKRSAYRVAMPTINNGDWNSRIFKKRKVADILDTSVLVLVDWSGSMSGDKAAHACEAAVLINEVFSKVLRMPLAVVSHAFTDRPNYGIIKDFDLPASSDQIRKRFGNFTGYMSGNDDHDALLFAYRTIRERKSKRKVIIALSDGSPADGYGGSDVYAALKETAATIEGFKSVELYGLGIMDDNVKRFYKRRSVLKNAGDLEARLLELLSHIVTNEE